LLLLVVVVVVVVVVVDSRGVETWSDHHEDRRLTECQVVTTGQYFPSYRVSKDSSALIFRVKEPKMSNRAKIYCMCMCTAFLFLLDTEYRDTALALDQSPRRLSQKTLVFVITDARNSP
jgi:hypothetical protein